MGTILILTGVIIVRCVFPRLFPHMMLGGNGIFFLFLCFLTISLPPRWTLKILQCDRALHARQVNDAIKSINMLAGHKESHPGEPHEAQREF